MVPRAPLAAGLAIAAIAAIATSCRRTAPPAIDPALASCVPAGTLLLAGVNLERLRAAPLYKQLPPSALMLLEPLHDAVYLLLASNGKTVLSIARGPFRLPPPGATLIEPTLAIAGPADLVRAAAAQHKTAISGAPDLFTHAEPLAAAKPIWLVVQGGVTLPLTGNAANLNRLLRGTEYATIDAKLGDRISLDLTVACHTADGGRRFEENLRAIVSLAAAANARHPDLAALLNRIQVHRDHRTIHATVSAGPDALNQFLRVF